MQTREQPTRPWQQIAADIYKSGKDDYMLVVDYYSNMAAVKKLTSFNAKSIIEHLKDIFMLYGLPTVFVSDNGLQFSSREFQEFLRRGYMETQQPVLFKIQWISRKDNSNHQKSN